MKRLLVFNVVFFVALLLKAQTITTNPTIPSPDQPVTITVDVSGTSINNFPWDNVSNPVWIWTWIENGATDIDAPTNVNPATSPGQDAAKCIRISTNPDKYQITFTPTIFFNKPASEIKQIGLKLKSRNWSDNKQTDNDKFITFSEGFAIAFAKPTSSLFFVNSGESIDIEVSANQPATIVLKIGGNTIASSTGSVSTFSYTHTATEANGSIEVTTEANNGSTTKTISFKYVIRTATITESRPAGIIDGINYHTDQTKATVSLWAPGKASVFVLGDFNNWEINPAYQMKKDGEHFWLQLTGLTAGQEYGFHYLVDESLKIADPYADKILDPDDQYIPASSYPNLKPYPAKALSEKWYFNRLSVLQTGQQPYSWAVTNFQKPAKEDLVVYELLVRDFFGSNNRNYQNLIDTIGYFKRLGVNAIELMPIMEFNGNESWGYNPAFMFAPDKYYGTKNKFKEFVDKCHQNGIAVILDIAMNHQDMPNSYVMMDFDFVTGKPEADNKWVNVTARHPFNVFFDMNHESLYTKKYLDTVNHYWLNEYNVDGFRFDLSKGFTQQNNPNNVDAWSAYDASRIAILKRMADKIWEHTPDAYVILEHLSVNSEEKELAEYRAADGKGMMLWGKMTDQYNQNTMGYAENNDITGVYHASRGWTVPHLISYMESHDEERLMYKNEVFGSISGSYSVKDTLTALSRVRAASTIFYTIPGPKMLWQFGELGYDKSINHCPDGTNNSDCRVSPKPVRWEYQQDSHRQWLYNHISDLNRLRKTYDVFTHGTATMSTGNSLAKQVVIKNDPYNANPSSVADMNAVVAANFDLVSKNISVEFPHAGTWYDYYADGSTVQVNGSSASIVLEPGGYKLFTDVPIESFVVTDVEAENENVILLYPNPVGQKLVVKNQSSPILSLAVYTNQGKRFTPTRLSDDSWDVAALHPGLFIVEIKTNKGLYRSKIIKR